MKTMLERLLLVAIPFALAACGGGTSANQTPPAGESASEKADDHDHDADHHNAEHEPLTAPISGLSASEAMVGLTSDPIGQVMLTDGPNGFLIRVDIRGLTEGFHGIHLHSVGDCSDHENGFKASGGHVNPGGQAHGLMNMDGFELGDLPNIYAHHGGHARAEFFVKGAQIDDVRNEDGFAVVVHANEDDHQTQPIGNSGPRVGCAAFH